MPSCGRCGARNRDGRRFCGDCGAALAVGCEQCGFVNEPGEKFCGGCGAPTGARAPAAPARRSGELRYVVVLFADLSGYTQLSQRMDPEETHRLLERFFDVVDGAVTNTGGTIDKHIGDNVMALFGAPVAHGNDAERAARAALSIHEGVSALGREVSVELSVSVGIAAGQVMASGLGSAHHTEYTVIGSSVNLASRLQGYAAAGETLIDETVQRAIASHADTEPLGELELKGMYTPTPAWRLSGMHAHVVSVQRPIIGRTRELERLCGALDACAQRGVGSTYVLRGDAGIGKSRLAAECIELARASGVRTHEAAFVDFGASDATLSRLLSALVDRQWSHELRARDPRAFLGVCDVLEWPVPPALKSLHDALEPSVRTSAQDAAVVALASHACERAPRLFVVEDLHWADAQGRRIVGALARVSQSGAAMLLATTRPELELDHDEWTRVMPGVDLHELRLEGLAAEDGAALAVALGVGSDAAISISDRAGGNPLFLEQLAASASESPNIAALPGSVQSIVLARLDRLSESNRAALQTASVLGVRFRPRALQTMLGNDGELLAQPIRRGLIVDAGGELAFQHALVRDAVYSSLTRERRKELHLRAATLLGVDDVALRARHLDAAGDRLAAQAYCAAAREELVSYRAAAALELLDRACELAEGAERFVAETARAEVLRDTGAAKAAIAAYQRAVELADSDAETCQALLGEAASHRMISDHLSALATLERADAIVDSDANRVAIHWHRAAILFTRATFDASRREAERAMAIARALGDPTWLARSLSAMGDVEFADGNMLRARDYFGRCAAICTDTGMTRYALPNRLMYVNTLMWHGDLDAARDQAAKVIAQAVELGDNYGEIFARIVACHVGMVQRRFDESLVHVVRALELSRQIDSARWITQALTLHAIVLDAQGGDGADFARESLAVSHDRGVLEYVGSWTLAALALTTDDADEYRTSLDRGERLIHEGTMALNELMYYELAAAAALRKRDRPRAERYINAFATYIERYEAVFMQPRLAGYLAELETLDAAN